MIEKKWEKNLTSGLNILHAKKNLDWKGKLKSHKKVSKNKDFYGILMPSGEIKTLEFSQNQIFD